MSRDLSEAEKATLEQLIDAATLSAVLEAISEICGAKAEHIRHSWNDTALARYWDNACGRVGITVATSEVQRVSGWSQYRE